MIGKHFPKWAGGGHRLQDGKSPGDVGFPVEFYTHFRPKLLKPMLLMLTAALEKNELQSPYST